MLLRGCSLTTPGLSQLLEYCKSVGGWLMSALRTLILCETVTDCTFGTAVVLEVILAA